MTLFQLGLVPEQTLLADKINQRLTQPILPTGDFDMSSLDRILTKEDHTTDQQFGILMNDLWVYWNSLHPAYGHSIPQLTSLLVQLTNRCLRQSCKPRQVPHKGYAYQTRA